MVQNVQARTVTHSPRSVATSQLLSNLQWFPIYKWINFKVATVTYKVLSTQQPAYLHNLISYHQCSRLLSYSSQSFCMFPVQKPSLDIVLSLLLLLKSGTIYTAIRVSSSLDSLKRHLKTLVCYNTHHLGGSWTFHLNCNAVTITSRQCTQSLVSCTANTQMNIVHLCPW